MMAMLMMEKETEMTMMKKARKEVRKRSDDAPTPARSATLH